MLRSHYTPCTAGSRCYAHIIHLSLQRSRCYAHIIHLALQRSRCYAHIIHLALQGLAAVMVKVIPAPLGLAVTFIFYTLLCCGLAVTLTFTPCTAHVQLFCSHLTLYIEAVWLVRTRKHLALQLSSWYAHIHTLHCSGLACLH